MDTLVNWLSNFYIGHPVVQTLTDYTGKILEICFVLLLLFSCLFLAFAKLRYYFPKGSISERFWQVGWLLQFMVILLQVYSEYYLKQRDLSTTEIIFCFLPYVPLLIAMVLGGRYYKQVGGAIQMADIEQAKVKQNHSQ